MLKHVRCVLWALQVLWQLKRISVSDRLRLWRKTFNLYLSFLAFTDSCRPTNQLQRAMLCAVLSAIYDYETDWQRTDHPGGSMFFGLLDSYQFLIPAKAMIEGKKLFFRDWSNSLSVSGLERGSEALRFYNLVIASQWMSDYSSQQITQFGAKFQIVDDLLDLDKDREKGDLNCFISDNPRVRAEEAREFLESDFFRVLQVSSRVYRVIRKKCEQRLKQLAEEDKTTLAKLAKTSRLPGMAYVAVMVIAGFRFYQVNSWWFVASVVLAFIGIHNSIMSYNDYVDREHDRKKGKTFASDHSQALLKYVVGLSGVTVGLLLLVGWQDPAVAVFCGLVWVMGLAYSHFPGLLLVNNLVVALTAASPALCGLVHERAFKPEPILLFGFFVVLLLIREVYLDIRDAKIDKGYKRTVPVVTGYAQTWMWLIKLNFVLAGVVVIYSLVPETNWWIFSAGTFTCTAIMFNQSFLLLNPRWAETCKWSMDWCVRVFLITLLLTQ
ncbi:MAG: UbiA family prenyltransferase [Patescibacteria group bacterium]